MALPCYNSAGKIGDHVSAWSLVRPKLLQLGIWAVLLALSLLIATQRVPTSFVTWEQTRGIPLTFVTLDEYHGPCGPEGPLCHNVGIKALHPFPLALDILILYLISCIVSFVLQRHLT